MKSKIIKALIALAALLYSPSVGVDVEINLNIEVNQETYIQNETKK